MLFGSIKSSIPAIALIGSLLLFAAAPSMANAAAEGARWKDAELEWILKRDKRGIQVYLAKVSGSRFYAILSTMEVDASPQELAALVMDLNNCKNWAAMCRSAALIERVSASESYIRSVNDAPFPVRDRDVVAYVKWLYDPVSGRISMHSDATPDKYPEQKGLIRVQYASSEWHFTPQENGKVLVENYAHIDPNGSVPAWLTNLAIVDSPYKTLKNMRSLVLTGRYQNTVLEFVEKPL